MGIRVICPACQAQLRVRDEFAGKLGKCPKCSGALRVPAINAPAGNPLGGSVSGINASVSAPPAVSIPAPPPFPPPAPGLAPPPLPAPPIAHAATTAEADVVAVDFTAPARRSGQRRPASGMPLWGWLAAAGVLLVAVAGGTLLAVRVVIPQPAEQPAMADRNQPVELKLNRAPFNPLAAEPVPKTDKPLPGAPLEDIVAYVKRGIVKIETSDQWNNRHGLGSGFIIDTSGMVATNYHVLSDAVKADVVFDDGSRFGIEGYTAIDPQTDLAIVKLTGVPPGVKALDLSAGDGPRDASQVYAIGHPSDNEFTTTGGIVGRVLRTSQLPADTRQWLNSTLTGSDDDLWIQHDAKISPGNSGGPLINARGDVVGVNSWVNQKLGLGYAIHARHLQELLRQQDTEVTQLKSRRRKLVEPNQQFAELQGASEHIKQLRARLAAKGWRPQTDDDCATFDELARTITAVKFIQAHPEAQVPTPFDEQQAVEREADAVVAALRAIDWHDRDQILPINAHGGKKRPPYGGAFLFGRVKRLIRGPDRESGLLIELLGNQERFFLPLDEAVAGLKEGDCVLVLGIAHPKTIQFGDLPRDANEVRILLSKVVLPVAR